MQETEINIRINLYDVLACEYDGTLSLGQSVRLIEDLLKWFTLESLLEELNLNVDFTTIYEEVLNHAVNIKTRAGLDNSSGKI